MISSIKSETASYEPKTASYEISKSLICTSQKSIRGLNFWNASSQSAFILFEFSLKLSSWQKNSVPSCSFVRCFLNRNGNPRFLTRMFENSAVLSLEVMKISSDRFTGHSSSGHSLTTLFTHHQFPTFVLQEIAGSNASKINSPNSSSSHFAESPTPGSTRQNTNKTRQQYHD